MCGHHHHNNQNKQPNVSDAEQDKARRSQTEPLQRAKLGAEDSDTRRFDQAEIDVAAQSQQGFNGQTNQQPQQQVNNALGHGYWGWGFPWWIMFFVWPLFGWLDRAFSDNGPAGYFGWGHGFWSSGLIWPLLIVGAIILIGKARRGGFGRW